MKLELQVSVMEINPWLDEDNEEQDFAKAEENKHSEKVVIFSANHKKELDPDSDDDYRVDGEFEDNLKLDNDIESK